MCGWMVVMPPARYITYAIPPVNVPCNDSKVARGIQPEAVSIQDAGRNLRCSVSDPRLVGVALRDSQPRGDIAPEGTLP